MYPPGDFSMKMPAAVTVLPAALGVPAPLISRSPHSPLEPPLGRVVESLDHREMRKRSGGCNWRWRDCRAATLPSVLAAVAMAADVLVAADPARPAEAARGAPVPPSRQRLLPFDPISWVHTSFFPGHRHKNEGPPPWLRSGQALGPALAGAGPGPADRGLSSKQVPGPVALVAVLSDSQAQNLRSFGPAKKPATLV
jgi:hypothetical protein